ncbi:MAG: phosphatase PAP2 family protein [Candidatus Xenobia bacterium]
MTEEQRAAVKSIWIPGLLVLVLAVVVQAIKGQMASMTLHDISKDVMFNSGIFSIFVTYLTVPRRRGEMATVLLLALVLEIIIYHSRPESWAVDRRLYRIGFGIGVAATVGLLARVLSSKGDERFYAGTLLLIGLIWLLFPATGMYFHRLVVRHAPLVFDGHAYTIDGTFGFQPAQQVCLWIRQSDFWHNAMYWLYQELPLLMTVATLLSLHWPKRAYPNVLLIFIVMGFASYLSYSVLPMVGINLWVGNAHWPNGPLPATGDLTPWAEPDGWTRNCFPSMHMAWMLAIYLSVRRIHPMVRAALLACVIGMVGSTLDIGCHYATDLVGSFPWVVMFLCMTASNVALKDRLPILAAASVMFFSVLGLVRWAPMALASHPVFTAVFVPLVIAGSLALEHQLADLAVPKAVAAELPRPEATAEPAVQGEVA